MGAIFHHGSEQRPVFDKILDSPTRIMRKYTSLPYSAIWIEQLHPDEKL